MGVDRQLTALGAAHFSGHADDIAHVDQGQEITRFLWRGVLVAEDLNLAGRVMDIHKHAGIARRVHPSGNGYDVAGQRVGFNVGILLRKFLVGHGAVKMRGINFGHRLTQFGKLLRAHFGDVGRKAGLSCGVVHCSTRCLLWLLRHRP